MGYVVVGLVVDLCGCVVNLFGCCCLCLLWVYWWAGLFSGLVLISFDSGLLVMFGCWLGLLLI